MNRPSLNAILIGPDRKVEQIDLGENPPDDYGFLVPPDLTQWPIPDASHYPQEEVRAKRCRWVIAGRRLHIYSVLGKNATISLLRKEGLL